jgi:hypothetical protein
MITNIGDNLKYLTLDVKNFKHDEMKILSKLSLPPSLYYLDLHVKIEPYLLPKFFKNFNQVGLKKLLIKNDLYNNTDTTTEVIKGIEGKSIEFLSHDGEKLVEFQSSIKLMKYNELVVKVSEIDGCLINS